MNLRSKYKIGNTIFISDNVNFTRHISKRKKSSKNKKQLHQKKKKFITRLTFMI